MNNPAKIVISAPQRTAQPAIGDLLDCPECAQPTEVVDTFTLPSTDGPVQHLRISCIARHHFVVPVD